MPQEAITSPYVDYEYYSKTFLGTAIPDAEFPRHEKMAEAFLHRITFDRVKRLPEIPTEVKDAICAMAECYYQQGKKTPGVKSENIDGYSVSYGDTDTSSNNVEMIQTASTYLSNTGLLFRGRSRKYDRKC